MSNIRFTFGEWRHLMRTRSGFSVWENNQPTSNQCYAAAHYDKLKITTRQHALGIDGYEGYPMGRPRFVMVDVAPKAECYCGLHEFCEYGCQPGEAS